MRSASRFLAALAMLSLCLAAFADVPSADKVMANARAKAKASHKNVLVMFDASW